MSLHSKDPSKVQRWALRTDSKLSDEHY